MEARALAWAGSIAAAAFLVVQLKEWKRFGFRACETCMYQYTVDINK